MLYNVEKREPWVLAINNQHDEYVDNINTLCVATCRFLRAANNRRKQMHLSKHLLKGAHNPINTQTIHQKYTNNRHTHK